MNAKGTGTSNLTAAMILLALAGSAGPAGAQSRPVVEKLEKSAQGFGSPSGMV